MLKRTFDVVTALIGLILLTPYFLIVSLLIKWTSPGPIFYRGRRVGQHGRIFTMYKFRTMVANAERIGPAVTYDEDPRITPIGRLLRNARLDEFPQLWNILKGDMSFVGPRPEAPYYYERYTDGQKRIFEVRPGLTGLSQIRFRHEEDLLTNPETIDEDYLGKVLPAKVALDMAYIENHSLVRDVVIILETLAALVLDRLRKPSVPTISSDHSAGA